MNSGTKTYPSKMTLSDDACYKIVEDEAVVLDIQSGEYFNLNKTGTEVLERAVAGLSVDQIADEMKDLYRADKKLIEIDVKELIQALLEKNILLVSD